MIRSISNFFAYISRRTPREERIPAIQNSPNVVTPTAVANNITRPNSTGSIYGFPVLQLNNASSRARHSEISATSINLNQSSRARHSVISSTSIVYGFGGSIANPGLHINVTDRAQTLDSIVNNRRRPANKDAMHILEWCRDSNINVTLDCNVSECEGLIKYFSKLVDVDRAGNIDLKRKPFIVSALKVIFDQIKSDTSFKDKLIAVATRDSDDCSDRAIYGLVELLCLISNSKLESQIGTGDLSTYKFIKELEEKKTLDQFCRDLGNAHVRNIKQKGLSFKEDIEVNLFLWDLFKTELGLPADVSICRYAAYALLGGEFLKNLIDTLAVSGISVDPSVIKGNPEFTGLLEVKNVNVSGSSNPSNSFLGFCANPYYRPKLKEMFNIIRTEDSKKNQKTFIEAMEKRLEMLKFQDGTTLYNVYVEKKNDFLDNDYNLDTVGIYNLCQAIDDILILDENTAVKESFVRDLLTTNDALYLSRFNGFLSRELSKLVARNTPALKTDAYTQLSTIQDKDDLLEACESLLLSPEGDLSDIEASHLVSRLIEKIENEISDIAATKIQAVYKGHRVRNEQKRIELFQNVLESRLIESKGLGGLELTDIIDNKIILSRFESRQRLLEKCAEVLGVNVDTLSSKKDSEVIDLLLNKLRSYAAIKIQAVFRGHKTRKELTAVSTLKKLILTNVDMSTLLSLSPALLEDLNHQGTNKSKSITELLQRISSEIAGDPVTEDTVIDRLKAFSVEKRKSKDAKLKPSSLDYKSWPAWGISVFTSGRDVFGAQYNKVIPKPKIVENLSQNTILDTKEVPEQNIIARVNKFETLKEETSQNTSINTGVSVAAIIEHLQNSVTETVSSVVSSVSTLIDRSAWSFWNPDTDNSTEA